MAARIGRLLLAVTVAALLVVSELTALLAGIAKQINQKSL